MFLYILSPFLYKNNFSNNNYTKKQQICFGYRGKPRALKETIIKNDKLEEKYKAWQDSFEKIKTEDISSMNDYIFELDTILEKKEYKKFDDQYSNAELHLYKIRTKINNLLD